MCMLYLGLDRTGHMSFLTGPDRTPKFAGQVLPDRTESGLLLPAKQEISVLIRYVLWTQIWCKNAYKYNSGFSPVRQDLSGKFGCLVLSGQETHLKSGLDLPKTF